MEVDLVMEAVCTFEMLIYFHKTTCHYKAFIVILATRTWNLTKENFTIRNEYILEMTNIQELVVDFTFPSMHLWNVGQLQRNYTALHPRRL
jgi:hypothetical protein